MTRVLRKANPNLPHEVMLTVDAATGQNALSQIKHFKSIAGVNSLSVTKLDGTAKGGIVIAMAEKYGLPIRFIGVGESMDDLRPFVARDSPEPYCLKILGLKVRGKNLLNRKIQNPVAARRVHKSMIRFSHVSKRYPGGNDALKSISFHLERGSINFLTGHSGAGKSSLPQTNHTQHNRLSR